MKLNRILNLLIPVFILTFSSAPVFSQDTSDSSHYHKAMDNTMAVYHRSFGNQSALYNGSQYGEYPFRFNEGQPFFYSAEPAAGSVVYDGVRYDSVVMRYNEVTDELILNDRTNRIQLLNKRIEYFNLYNADFIRLEKDSFSSILVSSGFYNLLYKGKVTLLKKQVKHIREVISSGMELQHFADAKDFFYLKKDNAIYLIKSKRDLYRLFSDRKKEVQQFVKLNGLNFRKGRQDMLTKATAFYDSLKK